MNTDNNITLICIKVDKFSLTFILLFLLLLALFVSMICCAYCSCTVCCRRVQKIKAKQMKHEMVPNTSNISNPRLLQSQSTLISSIYGGSNNICNGAEKSKQYWLNDSPPNLNMHSTANG